MNAAILTLALLTGLAQAGPLASPSQPAMASDPLQQLREIHLPAPISSWPPAPGWWLLALLALVLAVLSVRFLRARHRRNAWRRQALSEWQALQASLTDQNARAYLQQANSLLKRAAAHRHGTATVAALHGNAWLAFLDRSGDTNAFSQGEGRPLGSGPYQATPDSEALPALHLLIKRWLEQQH